MTDAELAAGRGEPVLPSVLPINMLLLLLSSERARFGGGSRKGGAKKSRTPGMGADSGDPVGSR